MLMADDVGGPVGCGISSAISRALCSGRNDDADALFLPRCDHGGTLAAVPAVVLPAVPARYTRLGGSGRRF